VRAREERQQLLDSERAARMEAERLGRVKDEFLATLSHELRTPLNSILGWTQLVRKEPANPELRAKGLEVIERNARAQAQLISDLLDMSRVISGKLHVEFAPLDLHLIVESAVESLRPVADARKVRVTTVLHPIARPVHGDAERLRQVVWNLLSNAIKFTDAGGSADVMVSEGPKGAVIAVRDTGRGIKPEFVPHIFERFRQQDASSAREHGGLGLGLALVKELVTIHRGEVHVDSPGEGQGATFTVTLPFARPTGRTLREAPLEAGLSGDLPRLTGVKVLVVDDDEDARGLLRRMLENVDAEVLTASSVEQALAIAQREHPHVLLSDIGMPGSDGYQLIRELRRRGSTIPAVALTAFARSEDRTRALLAGFQTHVPKPIEPSELLATVASLVGKMSV
jgi:CheY-like chemotaxis protein/nitrogen-specific signal transduction histidine kinase